MPARGRQGEVARRRTAARPASGLRQAAARGVDREAEDLVALPQPDEEVPRISGQHDAGSLHDRLARSRGSGKASSWLSAPVAGSMASAEHGRDQLTDHEQPPAVRLEHKVPRPHAGRYGEGRGVREDEAARFVDRVGDDAIHAEIGDIDEAAIG